MDSEKQRIDVSYHSCNACYRTFCLLGSRGYVLAPGPRAVGYSAPLAGAASSRPCSACFSLSVTDHRRPGMCIEACRARVVVEMPNWLGRGSVGKEGIGEMRKPWQQQLDS